MNPVVIIYKRPVDWTDRVARVFAGEFTHCEIYLPAESCSFSIFRGGVIQCSAVLPNLYRAHPELFSWHMFGLNDYEYRRLRVWNTNQVTKRCEYNLSDLAYQMLPVVVQTAFVPDISREEAQHPHKLFCSQAVVLALREACNGQHASPHLEAFVKSLNSRITTPTELADRTTTYMGMELSSGPVPLTAVEAHQVLEKNRLFQGSRVSVLQFTS